MNWAHPIPVDAPRFKRIGPGVYDTPDGRITLYRIEGCVPPAWNVEWTTDYAYRVAANGQDHNYASPLYSNIVDGAATKRDALELFRDGWKDTRLAMERFET